MEKGKPQQKIEEKKIPTIEKAIEKTGYVLEHKVASLFEKAKWAVIHNRYYLDDVTEIQREMDMIAYKTVLLEDGVRLFTALIISCKKNEEFDWVFLTRKAPGMNVNINMLPVNFSSSIDVFNFQIAEIDWGKDRFIESYDPSSLINSMYNYDRIVFAYQEIRKTNNAPSNDSNIYASIGSLIKAQSYEISSLKNRRRKDEKYVYNINLLSVADIDFHELHYDGNNVETLSIDRINYLNRFLISSQEQHSKIDFIKFDSLEKAIEDYNTLHDWNINFYKRIISEFYSDIFDSYNKRMLIIEREKKNYLMYARYFSPDIITSENDFSFLYLKKENDTVSINITDNEDINHYLNSNTKLIDYTSTWLKSHFRYEGKFDFSDDGLPF
jgi:hypothetical protein